MTATGSSSYKQHKNAKGKWERCYATKRACRYQSTSEHRTVTNLTEPPVAGVKKINSAAIQAVVVNYNPGIVEQEQKLSSFWEKLSNKMSTIVETVKTERADKQVAVSLKKFTEEAWREREALHNYLSLVPTPIPEEVEIVNWDFKKQKFVKEKLTVAEAGQDTSQRCYKCKTYVSKKYLDKLANKYDTPCMSCGEPLDLIKRTPFIVEAHPQEAKMLLQDETLKQVSWYHVSKYGDDWVSDLKESRTLTHVGSKQAAIDRMSILVAEGTVGPFYVHEVKLKPSVKVNPNTYKDDIAGEMTSDYKPNSKHDYRGDEVNRYVNFYEDPGSVSLMLSSQLFDLVGSRKVNL